MNGRTMTEDILFIERRAIRAVLNLHENEEHSVVIAKIEQLMKRATVEK